MARIAIAIGLAAVGFFLAGPFGPALLGAAFPYGVGAGVAAASVGFSVGSTLGNALFPGHMPHQYGPHLDDLLVSTSNPGAPIPICYGTYRYAGQIFWAPGLVESSSTTSQQSKDGGVTQTTYTYSASFAVSFGEGPADVLEIWGDSKVLYVNGSKVPNSTNIPAYDINNSYAQGDLVSYKGQYYQALTPVGAGLAPDQQPFGALVWSLYSGPTSSTNVNKFSTPAIYPGVKDQPQDPTIMASNGDTFGSTVLTPAYRGQVYAVWNGLQLKNFGNRIPNLVGLIRSRLPNTLDYIVGDVARRCNVPINWYDFSKLATLNDGTPNLVWGYVISRPCDGRTALSELAAAYFFDLYESDFLLQGRRRADDSQVAVTLSEDDLGLVKDKAKLTETLMMNQELPIEVDVAYSDVELSYQRGSQLKRRHGRTVRTRNKSVLELPLALTSFQARKIAEQYLYLAWLERNGFNFNTWKAYYMVIDPTDIIQFTYNGTLYKTRVVRNNIGQNFINALQLVEHEGAGYITVTAGGVSSGLRTPTQQGGTNTVLF